MAVCNNCPRKCNIDRLKSVGICGVGESVKIARAGLHFGEEPCISSNKGSGTIFFSGCSLKCVMCQNYNISHECYGKEVSINRLAEIMKELEEFGANNINFVTPSHYVNQIEQALKIYKPNIPLVYNSSGYDMVETIEKNLFDVYLFDLKYFNSKKSQKYSKCSDYFEVASKAILQAVKIKGKPLYNEDGILQSGVIVRHLVLPSSTNDAILIIDWLKNNVPEIVFSLMSQYIPMYKADEFKELNRTITKREYEKVLNACYDADFSEIYIQDRKSANKDLIPTFDLTGI
jgi:putative pyruvate formate lyase activating enzyme